MAQEPELIRAQIEETRERVGEDVDALGHKMSPKEQIKDKAANVKEAVADKAGLARYGNAVVPLDEALVEAVVDLSGRPHLTFNAKLPSGKKFIGAYDVDLTQDFLQALVNHARICLHVNVRYGRNLHHVVEAIFKATARALRAATAREAGAGVPSTKGTL